MYPDKQTNCTKIMVTLIHNNKKIGKNDKEQNILTSVCKQFIQMDVPFWKATNPDKLFK